MVALMVRRNLHSVKTAIVVSLLAEWMFIALCSTILFRHTGDIVEMNLKPFWSYEAVANGEALYIYENLLNVIFFLPFGFLVGGFRKMRKWWIVLVCALVLSSSIEASQLIFKKGLCETDDVIHNTLGAMFGYGLLKLLALSIRKVIKQ